MTASVEALSLLGLVADSQKFRDRVQELISKTEAADKATLALQEAEKATAEATASKLQVADALLQSLQDQTSAIQEKNAASEAKIAAGAADLARRESELDVSRQHHAAEVARSLQIFESREAELKQKGAAQSEAHSAHAADMQRAHDRSSAHHLALRTIIGEARKGVATAS